MFWTLIGATLMLAVADWVAVSADDRRMERFLKPLVMVALIAAALAMDTADPAVARWLVVGALVLSLAGDVFLLADDRFVAGLASFLVAHLLYIAAFIAMGVTQDIGFQAGIFILAVAVVALLMRFVGVRVVKGAVEQDRSLGVAVVAYMLVISLMVAFAAATGRPAAIVGAVLFYVSDACIGWSRFVSEFRGQRLVIMTTYHLAQVALVLSVVGVA